mgnify:CR=1 FL=1
MLRGSRSRSRVWVPLSRSSDSVDLGGRRKRCLLVGPGFRPGPPEIGNNFPVISGYEGNAILRDCGPVPPHVRTEKSANLYVFVKYIFRQRRLAYSENMKICVCN